MDIHTVTLCISEIRGRIKAWFDAQGNTVENPRYLSKSEKRLKKAQRRLSKRFCQGKKQSNKNGEKINEQFCCGKLEKV